jgi:hypothetical protein
MGRSEESGEVSRRGCVRTLNSLIVHTQCLGNADYVGNTLPVIGGFGFPHKWSLRIIQRTALDFELKVLARRESGSKPRRTRNYFPLSF